MDILHRESCPKVPHPFLFPSRNGDTPPGHSLLRGGAGPGLSPYLSLYLCLISPLPPGQRVGGRRLPGDHESTLPLCTAHVPRLVALQTRQLVSCSRLHTIAWLDNLDKPRMLLLLW